MSEAPSPRPDPFFIADALALDLLNSVCAPWGAEIEWLGSGADLLDWMGQGNLLSIEDHSRLAAQLDAADLDMAAGQLRDLREWFRGFVTEHAGAPLTAGAAADLAPLNAILARSPRLARLAQTPDGGFTLSYDTQDAGAAALVARVAETLADLVVNGRFERIRNCEGPECTLWFQDLSKNNRRRWCTMAVCGNRAKARAFRARGRKEG